MECIGGVQQRSFVWGGDTEGHHRKEVRTRDVAKERWTEGPSSREGSLNDSRGVESEVSRGLLLGLMSLRGSADRGQWEWQNTSIGI